MRQRRTDTSLKEGGKNSRRPLGSLSEGAGWAAKLHRLRELLPPPLRGTSLKEGGKNSRRPLGSLCEGAGWAAKLHSLRELLPPSRLCRATSLSEGGKLYSRKRNPSGASRQLPLHRGATITRASKIAFRANVIKWLQKASLRYAFCYKSLAQGGYASARAPHLRLSVINSLQKASLRYAFCYKSLAQAGFPCYKMVAKGVTALCPLAINHSRKQGVPAPAPHICAHLRFCRKVRSRALYCCYLRAIEENRAQSVCDCGVFLKLTEFLFVSSKRNS